MFQLEIRSQSFAEAKSVETLQKKKFYVELSGKFGNHGAGNQNKLQKARPERIQFRCRKGVNL